MLVKDQNAATPKVTATDAPDKTRPAGGREILDHRNSRVISDVRPGLPVDRFFTVEGVDPFDTVEWERRDAVISGADGKVFFEQRQVEFPRTWSQTATNVVVQKYFRGTLGTPGRESSVRQMIGRVADTIYGWGKADGYFKTERDAFAFRDELVHLLLHQKMAFNSPVWFNVGVEATLPQCSACQPYHARVLTALGPMPIGEIVEKKLVGTAVYDGEGLTQIEAVKCNGRKPVYRIELSDGHSVEATGDHVVCAHEARRTSRIEWRRVDQLRTGMVMRVYPHAAETITPPGSVKEIAEAALAGWLQSDGFCGQYEEGTNRSLTVEFLTNGDEEHAWVLGHLETALSGIHHHVRDVETKDIALKVRRVRLYGEPLRPFVEKYRLQERGVAIRVPATVMTGSNDAAIAYLKSVFQAEGYVTANGQSCHVAFAVISPDWVKDIQILLTRVGVYSRIRQKPEKREDRHDMWELDISIASERAQFAAKVGFLSERKVAKLRETLELDGKQCSEIRYQEIVAIRPIGEMDVYDIQTRSGQYLSEGVLVHNCFINSVDDSMGSILGLAKTEGMLFKYGSGTGSNLSNLRSSRENLNGGGTASGPVSFMRGFDAFAGAIKSGGKTRRAAKMVILNIDHPDVVDFIDCKAIEEKKAWALIDAGYDGGFNVPGGAYDSVNYQNANHSVRVTDDFMQAVLKEGEHSTRAVTGDHRVMETFKARELMRKMSDAAWVCGDPGLQYDTTINDWHTSPQSGRINASNPCSEYLFLDDSACNLASLNLRKFQREDGDFDTESFRRAVQTTITAMEILVDNSSYPTERIAENSYAFRPLGLGYANLGALLMSRGLPYDSVPGRAYAAAITALMGGEAYAQSARIAMDATGPFKGYGLNEEPFLRVMKKHRNAVEKIDHALVPYELMQASKESWDTAIEIGQKYGFRNGQATVLAPTGTIAFLMDCDTTGVEPDIALVKYKRLVGGGLLKIVNLTVPEALRKLGYVEREVEAIIDFIDKHDTIEGAPHLKDEHLPVFDCAFRSSNGTRSIHYMGHIRMMSAVQPFLSGAISKTVNLPNECTVEDIEDAYIQAWKLGLKAIAVYRDGCKRTQPLSTNLKQATSDGSKQIIVGDPLDALSRDERALVEAIRERKTRPAGPPVAVRQKLADERASFTHKFSIGGHEGYITVGLYADGTPGEIFVRMAKEGSVIAGLMDSFATAISLALQHGVPLLILIEKFKGTRFEPSGFTGNQEIPLATSIMDYLFRWLSIRFSNTAERHPAAGAGAAGQSQLDLPKVPLMPKDFIDKAAVGEVPFPIEVKDRAWVQETDAPPCHECGTLMVRNGACHKCPNCGSTSGCS